VVDIVPVDVFSRQESIEFLTRRVPKGVSADEARLLAEELRDLPLSRVRPPSDLRCTPSRRRTCPGPGQAAARGQRAHDELHGAAPPPNLV